MLVCDSGCAFYRQLGVSLPRKFIIPCFYQLIDFIAYFWHLTEHIERICAYWSVLSFLTGQDTKEYQCFLCFQSITNQDCLPIHSYCIGSSIEDIRKKFQESREPLNNRMEFVFSTGLWKTPTLSIILLIPEVFLAQLGNCSIFYNPCLLLHFHDVIQKAPYALVRK